MKKNTGLHSALLLLAFLFSSSIIHAQCETQSRTGIHVVKKGETLYRIAKQHNISLTDLKTWNGINSNGIFVCQELIVGQQEMTPDDFNYQAAPSQADSGTILWNDSSPQNEKAYDQYLPQKGGTHLVMRGETVANLARLYGYTEEHFRKFNNLTPDQSVPVGYTLRSTDCACERVESYATNSTPDLGWSETPSRSTSPSTKIYAPTPRPKVNTETKRYEKDPNDLSDYYRPSGKQTPQYPKPSTSVENASATTAGANYLRDEEKEMIDEINLLRSNPAGYIPYVEAYIEKIKAGKTFSKSPAAAYELIDELKRTGPLSTLQPTECLYRAAEEHGKEAISIGSSDHQGQDGSWPWDRVRRACSQMKDGNENLVGGPDDIRMSMLLLLVDDGIPTRGHRRTLLKGDWKYVACYKSGQVGRMPNSWIQLFGS